MYDYQQQRAFVFTEEGQVMFLKIRDKAKQCIKDAGAVTSMALMRGCGGGSSWDMLACVDRLVELGEIKEIPNPISRAGQHRVFMNFDNQ